MLKSVREDYNDYGRTDKKNLSLSGKMLQVYRTWPFNTVWLSRQYRPYWRTFQYSPLSEDYIQSLERSFSQSDAICLEKTLVSFRGLWASSRFWTRCSLLWRGL